MQISLRGKGTQSTHKRNVISDCIVAVVQYSLSINDWRSRNVILKNRAHGVVGSNGKKSINTK